MSHKIFVNLPVQDLERAKAFFEKLGFRSDPQFTDANAACIVITEDIYTMLLVHARFKDFTPKAIADARRTTEVLTALSCDSKDQVNDLFNKAIAGGGTETRPAEDHGFMFSRAFNDLDGHIWELFWMDPKAIQG